MPPHGIRKAITIHRLEGLEVGQLLKFVLHAAGNEVRSGKSAAGFAYVHSPKAPRPIIYVLKQMIVQFAILARVRRRRGALHNQLAMSDNREESFSLLEDIIVADSQLVPKNVAVTPGVRVAHLSCSEFLAGQNITVVVLRQTNRHIDGNLGFDQQQTKRVVIRKKTKTFNLAICDCFAISRSEERRVGKECVRTSRFRWSSSI